MRNRLGDAKSSGVHCTGNDEAVVVFAVSGNNGRVWFHNGQAARVNVHLCLSGCNQSQIRVNAGTIMNYSDGSLFAFEDRASHEIFNGGQEERVNLAVGVLHPDNSQADDASEMTICER